MSEATVQRCSQEKVFLKIFSKFAGEHPYRSVILVKLLRQILIFGNTFS